MLAAKIETMVDIISDASERIERELPEGIDAQERWLAGVLNMMAHAATSSAARAVYS